MSLSQHSCPDFLRLIQDRVAQGISVVTLAGSGLSAPSGIPTARAFSDYLLHCIHLCMRHALNIRQNSWPEPPTAAELDAARHWVSEVAVGVAHGQNAGYGPGSSIVVEQEAIGALADWRSSLSFLSRARIGSRQEPELADPDCSVIDSFNTHLVQYAKPNLGHQMLAFLHRPLRIRTVLTTNFDTLIENAFLHAGYPLEVFDVHTTGALPHAWLVRSQPAVVKLHGTHFETRADYSLDAAPNERDKTTFSAYFENPYIHDQHCRGQKFCAPDSCLLILGFSGADQRILGLVNAAARHFGADERSNDGGGSAGLFNVYWVCHSFQDLTRLQRLYSRFGLNVNIHAVVERADLLLFELYQKLTNMIPPAGLLYEFAQYIPPSPTAPRIPGLDPDSTGTLQPGVDDPDWQASAPDILAALQLGRRRLLTFDGADGVSSLASAAFGSLVERGQRCLWFELDDFAGVEDLEAAIFQATHTLLGRTYRDFITLSTAVTSLSRDARATLLKHFRISPDEWVLFLYGRSSPGAAAGFGRDASACWTPETHKRLSELLYDLSGATQASSGAVTDTFGFRILYMPLSAKRKEALRRRLTATLGRHNSALTPLLASFIPDPHFRKLDLDFERPGPGSYSAIVESVVRWFSHAEAESEARQQFLYGLTLFRHSTWVPAICRPGVQFPHVPLTALKRTIAPDPQRCAEQWLSDLVGLGLIRLKQGGAYWLHRDLRATVQALLEHAASPSGLAHAGWAPSIQWRSERALMHLGIADGFETTFVATRNVTPLIEWCHHTFMCLEHTHEASPPHYWPALEVGTVNKYRTALRRAAVTGLIRAISRGRITLLTQLERPQGRALMATVPRLSAHAAVARSNDLVLRQLATLFDEQLDALLSAVNHTPETASHGHLAPLTSRPNRDSLVMIGLLGGATRQPRASAARALRGLHNEDAFYRRALQQYEEIKDESWAERSLAAQDKLRGIVRDLFGAQLPLDELLDGNVDAPSVTALIDAAVGRGDVSERRLELSIRCLRRLADTLLRVAEIEFQCAEVRTFDEVTCRFNGFASGRRSSSFARVASRTIWIARLFERFVLDDAIQLRESINLSMLEALSLAYLKHFKEAHRRLDEASAFLADPLLAGHTVGHGVLELRRAMVHLLSGQQHLLLGKRAAPLGFAARIQDAWDCLDRAQRLISGETRAVRWWEWLYLLQLRVIAVGWQRPDAAEQPHPLAERPGIVSDEYSRAIVEMASLLRPESVARAARVLWYAQARERGVLDAEALHQARAALERAYGSSKAMNAGIPLDTPIKDFAKQVSIALKVAGEIKW